MAKKTVRRVSEVANEVAVANARKVSNENLATDFATFQSKMQSAFASLTGEMSNKLNQLNDLNTAVSTLEDRLTELHEVDRELLTLDNARLVHEEELRKMSGERDNFNRESERQKQEYVYSWNMKVREDKDNYNREQAQRQREWMDRESALKMKEEEVNNLREQVVSFPSVMDAEVKKQVAISESRLTREYESKLRDLTKDSQTSEALYEGKLANLENDNTNLRNQLEQLRRDLEASRLDAKETAMRALEASAGRVRDAESFADRAVTGVSQSVNRK